MSFSLRRRPRGDSPPRTPRVRGPLVALLVVVLLLAAGFAWLTWGSGEDLPAVAMPWSPGDTPSAVTLAAAGGALAFALLAYVVVRIARRRRRRVRETPAPVGMLQLDAAPVEAAVETGLVEEPVEAEIVEEPVEAPTPLEEPAPSLEDERVTQLHIRTLETALEEQSAQLAEAQARLEHSSVAGRDVERVLLTVGALRERINGNPDSERILNRVEAAVARLGAGPAPRRPALPAPAVSERGALGAPSAASVASVAVMEGAAVHAAIAAAPPAPEPAQAPAPVVQAPAVVQAPPVVQPTPAPDPGPVSDTAPPASQETPPAGDDTAPPPQPVAPPADNRVLPVPAPPVQPVARPSRWRRRGAT